MQSALPQDRGDRIALGALGLLLALGVARAIWLAWTSDDAFISFRYAENLVSGDGLVYNAGERVEGYSNLLWTLMLATAVQLGVPIVLAAQGLGILTYATLALCLAHRSWSRHRSLGLPFLPLAAALVLVSSDFHEWSTGGLETMLFTLLAVQGLLLTRTSSASLRPPLVAGALFSLLVLTRPDGLLLAAAGAVSFLVPASATPRGVRLSRALCVAIPVAITAGVLVAFKLGYYGEVLPTPFYSKSVLRPWYSQGVVYVGLYLAKNWFLPASLIAILALRRYTARKKSTETDVDGLFLVGAAALFTAYLMHVGGDFMFARRLVPIVPLLLVALEDQVALLESTRLRSAVAAACIAGALVTFPLYTDEKARIRGVADERRYYKPWVLDARSEQGRVVGDALRGTPARVMFEGGMCSFGYYSRLPYLAEMTGLTQYSLARLPLDERRRVGHEKRPTTAWMNEHQIHLVVSKRFPPIPRPTGRGRGRGRGRPPFDQVYFGDVAQARVHIYSDAVMDRLRGVPGVSFVPIETALASALEQIEHASAPEAERIYALLDRYYFRGAGERGRLAALRLRAAVEARSTVGRESLD